MPNCRACPAEIIFAQQWPSRSNPLPKNNPLNAHPHENGNLRLDRRTMRYFVLRGQELDEARANGELLYISHFAVCPARQRFRKGVKSHGARATTR
jgi:hypothetical protein